jgi:hypothetical protein
MFKPNIGLLDWALRILVGISLLVLVASSTSGSGA